MDCGVFLLNQQSDISMLDILNNLYGFIQSATLWVFSFTFIWIVKGSRESVLSFGWTQSKSEPSATGKGGTATYSFLLILSF